MIDIHSHLLPELDDGSRSVTQSVEVLRDFASDGIEAVILTPHLKASEIEADGARHVEARAQALDALAAAAPDRPRLLLGFEIMLDEPLPAAAIEDRAYSLAASRYYLVEFPISVAGEYATAALAKIAGAGVVPMVAHPERYYTCGLEDVRSWRTVGARIQVDASTLTRRNRRGGTAREIVGAGLADVLAADNHGDGRSLRAGRELLEEGGFAEAARRLAVENPRAVVRDAQLAEVPPAPLSEGWLSRVRRALGG